MSGISFFGIIILFDLYISEAHPLSVATDTGQKRFETLRCFVRKIWRNLPKAEKTFLTFSSKLDLSIYTASN